MRRSLDFNFCCISWWQMRAREDHKRCRLNINKVKSTNEHTQAGRVNRALAVVGRNEQSVKFFA